MFISQTTDFHFANNRFSFRFIPFRFAPFRFVWFRFAKYSKPLEKELFQSTKRKGMPNVHDPVDAWSSQNPNEPGFT